MHVTDNVSKCVQAILTWWYEIIQNGTEERISNLVMFQCFVFNMAIKSLTVVNNQYKSSISHGKL